jgi:hypothetical protein
MKKTLLSLVAFTLLCIGANAQNVNIPDANFKAYLVANTAINSNSDSEIQVTEANTFTGDIYGNNLGITDLTGIEAFTLLNGLYLRDNNLGSIDISANTALTYIDCQNTNISALDISNNTALTGVTCAINNLSTLDVSNNTALTAINCGNNNLTSLDVSNNVLLSNFSCDNNNLTSLDVSNNSNLLYFVCFFNDITSLDLSNCTSLAHLSCVANELNSLDVSNCTSLGNLYCALNNISVLDLGANTSLQLLNCSSNNLSILNMANGNNVNVSTFNATGNPNLTCIQVDDAAWSTTNWTSIDAGASFNLDCNYNLGLDEASLNQSLTIYPNPSSKQLTIEFKNTIISAEIFNALGTKINAELTSKNTIDVSTLSNGVYILQIETDKGLITKKFMKN